MQTKVIVLEYRKAKKAEKGLYGSTTTEDGVSRIFINSTQSQQELINTLFHELAHAVMHFHNIKVSDAEEERVARLVGNVSEPCFRKYKSGSTKEFKPTGKRRKR